jgi:hypothetical protein
MQRGSNQQSTSQCHLLGEQKEKKTKSRVGGIRFFRLTLELLSYGACNIFNADPGGLHRPFDKPLHHRLQGDAGVTTPEAHQHVVGQRLCQSEALLQVATGSLLQLGYLPPDRV